MKINFLILSGMYLMDRHVFNGKYLEPFFEEN